MYKRESGIVMPIFSLPGPHGIGTLGAGAYRFVDFLARAQQTYWQILPLVPTGFGDSPYQSCCEAAGNPYLIDLDRLAEQGFLTPEEIAAADFGDDPDLVDYVKLYDNRLSLLRQAYERAKTALRAELDLFAQNNQEWLPDFALFMAIKQEAGMAALRDWPDAKLRTRNKSALRKAQARLADEIDFYVFLQYVFFAQWTALKAYANAHGISIIGDIPIYVSADSMEVWAKKDLFLLESDGTPKCVAGVPPDLYTDTGQLWGNPIYNWKKMERDGFSWWVWRLRQMSRYYDVIRIDHFRGLESYWAVPNGEPTAMKGKWVKGPAMKLIHTLRRELPELRIIAEDLGDIDQAVRDFLAESGLPGMKLLVDAFDPAGESEFLPHNIIPNCVAYTSTHDSPTFMDFIERSEPDRRRFAESYLRLSEQEGYNWGALKAIWGSPARLAMAPFADVLGLGADARLNIPGTLGGRNWRWRVRGEALNDEVADLLAHITRIYRRANP